MLEVKNPILLNKIKPLFKDIRFYMGTCVLDQSMGQAYVDNSKNPKFALLIVRSYCFMSGSITKEKLKKLIDHHLKPYILIPTDPLCQMIEELYQTEINKSTRYSIKKEVTFNQNKLNKMVQKLNPNYRLVQINEPIAQQIKEQDFIKITDNYTQNGIGYACYDKQKLIGVASSNIFYQHGIEVNIRVDEAYQRKGIGSALAAQLIIACLQSNKQVSWDAANLKSVGLAQKLGFTYASPYHTYNFSTPSHQNSINSLSRIIEKQCMASQEDISIIIKNLSTNQTLYQKNQTTKIVSASLIKVGIMLAILEEVKQKKLSLTEYLIVDKKDRLKDTEVFETENKKYTIEELIHWMIIVSDNTATNTLIKKIGMEKINQYFQKIHLKQTRLERYMLDQTAIKNGKNNYTSQEDMLTMFTLLYKESILTPRLCKKAIQILLNQRCQDAIMRYIYDPIPFAHKTGALDYLIHDAGVMNIQGNQIYIGISIWNCQKKKGNQQKMGTLGKEIYQYLKQSENYIKKEVTYENKI